MCLKEFKIFLKKLREKEGKNYKKKKKCIYRVRLINLFKMLGLKEELILLIIILRRICLLLCLMELNLCFFLLDNCLDFKVYDY